VVRLQGHLPCSYSTPRVTYSRVFFTTSTNSLMAEKTLHTNLHNTTTSQLDHNFYTTSSRLFATHQSSSHLSSTHQSSSLQSTSHLSSQLTYFTTKQLLLPTQLQYHLNNLLQKQHNFTSKYIYTKHNYSSILLELSCRRSVLLLHFG
jgi:hypothetical protein